MGIGDAVTQVGRDQQGEARRAAARSLLLPLVVMLALAAIAAQPARSQCPEPSALDLDGAATPLRVETAGSTELRISWESVTADRYRLQRGRLDSFTSSSSYSHRPVAETTAAELLTPRETTDLYFLVNSDCLTEGSGLGRDSFGVERPRGGLLVLAVGLQGGAAVIGAQFTLSHPAPSVSVERNDVSFVGPFAPGQPGNPFGVVNTNPPGLLRVAAVFGSFNPDPSFDPPPDSPIEIVEAVFGHVGPPPDLSDFLIEACTATDMFGNSLPDVSCVISRFELLF